MSNDVVIDAEALRAEVRDKYREVAVHPHGEFHFHTGRPLAARLGYDPAVVDALPDRAVESFAGVANPFSLRTPPARASGSSTSAPGRGSTASSPPPRSAPKAGSSAST